MSMSGVTVVGSDAPSDYHMAPRTTSENPSQVVKPQVVGVVVSPTPASTGPGGIVTGAVAGSGGLALVKKKRGRPRKYGPDGVAIPISPKPISSAAPGASPVIDFSVEKRGKIRPVGLVSKPHMPKLEVDNSGLSEWVSCSVGANFTPHIITVNTGEDVTMKIISFSQQGPRAICILSANGVISSVTLRQPDSSGGTLTYEGRFEILSLTGSFMPSETGGMRNRSGGMSVSLASPDGRVVGGGVAGLLVAAGPVQIVVGSFLAGNQHEQMKTKKNKLEPITATVVPLSNPDTQEPYNHSSAKSTMPASSINWSSSLAPESRNKPTDINVTLPA
ncbi:AT-hook motif nuclear-localized protein 1 [Capsicum annuum]|uniref:AT-hook motif nuclear-localized protein 1 n=1 Tax=Capsicum annuum TaxID=4072 RepID=UPI0007BFE6D9|nr:AT-hook motif nuclear-localized protein 1 [Capsicum annuum]KAF3661208.1 AT-hook motif nuclear-localized protein 1 [Capsicum annuum]